MHANAPEAGIASLLASRGRNGDSTLVHMAPEELKGLQAIAMAHGGTLTINPDTGLYEAGFLKKLLPMIAGAVLNFVAPGVGTAIGQAIGLSGTAAATVGTGLLVGGATGLIEGDLKKGLMAGLGAYSGANITSALQSAAAAPTAADKVLQDTAAKSVTEKAAEQYGLNPEAINLAKPATFGTTPELASVGSNLGVKEAGSLLGAAPASTYTMPAGIGSQIANATVGSLAQRPTDIMSGLRALTTPGGRAAFGQALGGGFESGLGQSAAKFATLTGATDAFTPEEQPIPTSAGGDDYMYIPGALNPKYGTGANEPMFLQGRYYKKSAQGLTPYNPFQMAPGYRGFAYGGMVSPPDQNMNQQRQIPDQSHVIPYPNQNYPLSTVVQSNYSSQPINRPQAQEVVSGYEPKINPFTGEEKFAEGGDVGTGMMKRPRDPGRDDPSITPPPSLKDYYQSLLTPPSTRLRDLSAMNTYLANLNRRATNPVYNPYGAVVTGGAGTGTGTGGGGTGGGGTGTGGTGTGGVGGGFNPFDPFTRIYPNLTDMNFGFAEGGETDTEYLAGGKLLEGPGDGMSDDIPAVIRGKRTQRAALADGEFVIPADVVSHLGNGSTKAGANKLYDMMDRLRQARTGKKKQAPAVNADRILPA